jgi:RND family efflux transporter MFP subunit
MTRFLLSLIALSLLGACGDRIEPGKSSVEHAVVSGLATIVVEPVAVPARYALPGTIESTDRGLLTARIPGQVARILVSKGQALQSGDTILELSGETATSGLYAAESAVVAAQQQLAEAVTFRALADKTYARYATLRQTGAVTPHEYDKVEADRDAAVERLGSVRAALEASKAQRAAARTLADQATLRAPYAATVAEIMVDAGSTVQPGMPLLALDRSGPWLVRVALPESMATGYRLGDTFRVAVPTLKKDLTGTLTELQPSADPGSRTITAWLTLPEDAELQGGLFARVFISDVSGMTTLMIPSQAVVTRGQLTGVYVVENDFLNYRLVRTGALHASLVEILSGLHAGEEIVAGDLARARHGARLERR